MPVLSRTFFGTVAVAVVLVAGHVPSGLGLGGLVLLGAGFGAFSTGQGQVCDEVPFQVTITYLPDGKALAAVTNGPQDGCMLSFGSVVFTARVFYDTNASPPVWMQYHCQGTEAAGLACFASDGTMSIGPYGGVGSAVSLVQTRHLSGMTLRGSFSAV